MVRTFEQPVNVLIDAYVNDTKNKGKVALFEIDKSLLCAEGDGNTDWVELEMMREEKRVSGNFRIVIVPSDIIQIESVNWAGMR